MPRTQILALACLLLSTAPAAAAVPVTLRGSPESMLRQNQVAREHGLDFLRQQADIAAALEKGRLVEIAGNDDYRVLARNGVALPEVRLFLDRFAADYRRACGTPLVVTSLTRASTRQPANSHPLSVHPAGMAVDLRVPADPACERWMNGELLRLEGEGLLDATREHRPPHFHVALFPQPYLAAVWQELGTNPLLALSPEPQESDPRLGAALAMLLEGTSEPLEWLAAQPAFREESSPGWLGRLIRLPLRLLGLGRA
jgi:hypothetical protein